MIILIERTQNLVTVDGVSRTVDLTMMASDLLSVAYDTVANTGIVAWSGEDYYIGKAKFDALYARYHQGWKAAGTPPVRTLSQVKLDKRDQINSHRDNLEQDGFSYLSKTFDSNSVSVQRIAVATLAAQAALAASQAFSVNWTAKDNSVVTLDGVAMMGMPVALATHAQTLHALAKAKKDLIDAATTILEVEAITW